MTPAILDGWRLERELASGGPAASRFAAVNAGSGQRGVLTLYADGAEPDPTIRALRAGLSREQVPALIAAGRWEGRAYDIEEAVTEQTLADLAVAAGDVAPLHAVAGAVGRILHQFALAGLRHRGLCPQVVLIRSEAPLDLVISGFGSAARADLDLDHAEPLEITRYTAPEAVAGAVSPASDWWSLGMMLLDKASGGACFAGEDGEAFLIRAMANGVALPDSLDPQIAPLLRGLLAPSRLARWQWDEVRTFLDGGTVLPPGDSGTAPETDTVAAIRLGEKVYRRFATFATAAAQAANWAEARDLNARGEIGLWAEESGVDARLQAGIRQAGQLADISADLRLALTLKAMHPAMPLVIRGRIMNFRWLRRNPAEADALMAGPAPAFLRRLETEPRLAALAPRSEALRRRARETGIALDEAALRDVLLSPLRAQLFARAEEHRARLPDTAHPGLAALMARRQTSDEDLALLIAAEDSQFRTADAVIAEAEAEAAAAGVAGFEATAARRWLRHPRRDLEREISERTAGFARCGQAQADEWADAFRVEPHLPLARLLVLLAVPAEAWQVPPRQTYVATLLDFFARKVAATVQRGPLTRFTIGRTSARIDLTELGGESSPAAALLDHLLARSERSVAIDAATLAASDLLERRLRRLHANATLHLRDTGVDGLYLGFPFLVMRDPRGSKRARIAPVLLWPVKLMPEIGRRNRISLAFDREREEVRLNPALESLIGLTEARRWQEDAAALIDRADLSADAVMTGLGLRAQVHTRVLSPLPPSDIEPAAGTGELVCAAGLFHLAYTGQAIAQDLALLKSLPIDGTGLEAALRLGEAVPVLPAPARVAEADRHFTCDSDPSQEAAVFAARSPPGLVVEGPPGTGKSQSIVNMVADAIGRGSTLLIVCQKQAALDVVHKRLVAEGLGDRVMLVTDVNRDRRRVIGAIRAQVAALAAGGADEQPPQQRAQLAARIEALEADLDRHHAALHQADPETGLSYRALLAELIELEAGAEPPINAPSLRARLASLDPASMAMLEETLAPLARHWLPARYENSPLAALKSFAADDGNIDAFFQAFRGFAAAEAVRNRVNQQTRRAFAPEDPRPSRTWLRAHASTFQAIDPATRANLAAWLPHFRTTNGGGTLAEATAGALELAVEALEALDDRAWDAGLANALVRLADDVLGEVVELTEAMTEPAGFWARLSPARFLRGRRLAKLLATHGLDADRRRWPAIARAGRLEQDYRPLRRRVIDLVAILDPGVGFPETVTPNRLGAFAATRLDALREVEHLVVAVRSAPCADELEAVLRDARLDRFEDLVQRVDDACARFDARQASRAALDALDPWIAAPWLVARRDAIDLDLPNTEALGEIWDARASLATYQNFRLRAARLGADSFATLAELRRAADALDALDPVQLDAAVRRILAREARLAWKARMEAAHPALLAEASEIATKVKALEAADLEIRALNRRRLAAAIDTARLGTVQQWAAVTSLNGPHALRLRQFLARAGDIGLMALRPVWLMNPDVASRMLPPKPALFDAVIYDEASQMPVEHALPTLFRGGTVVVSGDEKQMPPTAFFTSKVESDEAGILDADEPEEETADGEERDLLIETWNRREIKDCPDLLHLARAVLPAMTLDVHYRSAYRELISFSNAAFYGNRLNVPVRHPTDEIARARPIEMLRVDGTYAGQINEAEAARVVERLAALWRENDPPTVGVVTFNRPQADFIETALEERAENDEAFREALARERNRAEDGEDVGFFVKNVENVQGDERDVIVFSPTFGRDPEGRFRRHFGVLGQAGGERRLNVAVTRARRKIVMITSMPLAEISDLLQASRAPASPRDYLQAYLEYAQAVSAGDHATVDALMARLAPAEARAAAAPRRGDGFARAVEAFLRDLGHTPERGGDADAFGLDFVIREPGSGRYGLGIECDGPQHRLLTGARAREIWRPRMLARSVRALHRVSSRGWAHAGDEERRRLAEAVARAFRPREPAP